MTTVRDIEFPISDGDVIAGLKAALIAKGWGDGLTVQGKLPPKAQHTRRMVTVRDDSGPQEGRLSFRRYGFNWYADSSVDAKKMALAGMSGLRLLADGSPIALVDSFSGPYEIEDEVPYVVGTSNLTHMYSSCRIAAKGFKP